VIRQDSPKLDQCLQAQLRSAKFHRLALGGVTHPRRTFTGDSGWCVEMHEFVGTTAYAPEERHSLPVQRMPAILDNDRTRSVCGMTLDPAAT